MHVRSLGRSGLKVSSLTLGTMNWGGDVVPEDARSILEAFLDAGGTTIDTAYGYGDGASEALIGELLQDLRREDVVLISKAGISRRTGARVVDTSRRALLDQLDESLTRLGTDHLDLWLAHTWSNQTPWEETLGALEHAVASGRTRYVGVSNYSGWQLALIAAEAHRLRIPLVCNQIQYNLLMRAADTDVVPAADHLGVGLMAWSPLAGGLLTGKYRSGVPAASRAASGSHPNWASNMLPSASGPVMKALATAAEGLDVSQAELALAWLRDHDPVVSAVVGARSLSQVRPLLASEDVDLPPAIAAALDDVSG
ncbi:aldo/keto reductase [Calidifontibacter terrae]